MVDFQTMILTKENCGSCKKQKILAKKNYSLFSGILLALLPKCPFCIMAFTSTAMLCGKDVVIESQSTYNSTLTIFLTSIFCSLIIAGILLNYRGIRTRYALLSAGAGILLVLNSVIRNGGPELYYMGVSIVFIAVWLNGSLISILRKLNNTFFISKKNVAGSP